MYAPDCNLNWQLDLDNSIENFDIPEVDGAIQFAAEEDQVIQGAEDLAEQVGTAKRQKTSRSAFRTLQSKTSRDTGKNGNRRVRKQAQKEGQKQEAVLQSAETI